MSDIISVLGLGASLIGAAMSFFYADRSRKAGVAAAVAAEGARDRLWLGRLVSQVHRFELQILVLDTIGRKSEQSSVALLLRQLRHEAGELRGLMAKDEIFPLRLKSKMSVAVAQLGASDSFAFSVEREETPWFPEEALRAASDACMVMTEWIAAESTSLGGSANEL